MELRPELLPPAVAAERRAGLEARIATIRDLLARSDPAAAAAAIAAFNEATGHDCTAEDLRDGCGGLELGELAARAAAPPARRVPDVTRDELAEIVRRIMAVDPHTDFSVDLLEANVVMPGVTDLIFHPPPHLEDAGAEEIVDEALAYRPTAL